MSATVSIIGLGWLGLPLAKKLQQEGFVVKGTTTSTTKKNSLIQQGIDAFLFQLAEESIEVDEDLIRLFDTDYLIINIPPGIRRKGADFALKLHDNLLRIIPQHSFNVVFVSSTAVYPALNCTVAEADVLLEKPDPDNPLQQIEFAMKKRFDNKLTILRYGGLFGGERNPLKYYSPDKLIKNGHIPVNYLHQDDAVNAIFTVLKQEKWNEIYNVVAPNHPTRKEVFESLSIKENAALPEFDPDHSIAYKVIDGSRFKEDLRFEYAYPNPATFTFVGTP